MAFVTADRIADTTTTVGTSPLVVSGAAPLGSRTFSTVMSVGDTCYYSVQHQTVNEWEVGLATYSSANTLTRTTIYSSSNAGSTVNFSAGTKDVFITMAASRTPQLDASGKVTPATGTYTRTTFTATAGQTSFTASYTVGYVQVYVNGILLNSADYTATTGTTVVLASAAAAGDIVDVIALNIGTFTSGGYTRTTYTASAGQTTFTAAYTPNYVQVYANGVLLDPTDYTASSGTAIVLGAAATAGDTVDIVALNIGGFTGGVTITGTPVTGQLTSWTGSSSVQGFAPSATGDIPFTANGTTWSSTQKIVRDSLRTPTSGTSVDFTGIPSWVKRITIMVSGLSGAAGLGAGVQLGTSGLVTTGYVTGQVSPPAATYTAVTDKIVTFGTSAAASTVSGIATLTTLGNNIWVGNSVMNRTTDNFIMLSAGTITLSGVLDQVSVVTTVSTFDAGTVNILYE